MEPGSIRRGPEAGAGMLFAFAVIAGTLVLFSFSPAGQTPGSTRVSSNLSGSTTITVQVRRLQATYWAPCFAATCSAGTGPGTAMYVVLYDASGNVIQTGYADENGHTFNGLNPQLTYYVYPSDCRLCHGSNHDVVFSGWSDGTTTRPLAVVPGTNLVALYSCTNGCA